MLKNESLLKDAKGIPIIKQIQAKEREKSI